MLRFLTSLLFLFIFSISFAQWTRSRQLPSSDIYSLYHREHTLYAGTKNRIYFSRDQGQNWDSTQIIPGVLNISQIIVYRNDLYAASFLAGAVKSTDGGITWMDIGAGLQAPVSDFSEFNGQLFASTLGNSMYVLDSMGRNHWSGYSSGLSNLSANITALHGNKNALIAGTLNNGLYDYLPIHSTTWEERFLFPRVRPSDGVYDIISAHDSLLISGRTGNFFLSLDNGLTWNPFGNTLPSWNTLLLNTSQALISSRIVFNGAHFNTAFYYIRKDSLQYPFVSFSFLPDFYTYKTDILGDQLWNASNKGLYQMSLSSLNGISEADDSTDAILSPPPSCCIPDSKFRIWPNPTRGEVTINVTASMQSQGLIKVFNIQGVLLQVTEVNLSKGNNQFQIDISSLNSGLYSISTIWNKKQMEKAVWLLKE